VASERKPVRADKTVNEPKIADAQVETGLYALADVGPDPISL
jgi:hypothetical protein